MCMTCACTSACCTCTCTCITCACACYICMRMDMSTTYYHRKTALDGSRPNAHTDSYQVQDRSISPARRSTAWLLRGGAPEDRRWPTQSLDGTRSLIPRASLDVEQSVAGAIGPRTHAHPCPLYPPQPNTPSLPPFAPHRPNLRLTCVYAYIRLRLRLRLRLLGLPHGCLHTRPHPCPRLRLHPRVPIVCLWLYAYAYAVVAAPLPPPPPPPPPPPRPRRPPAAAEPPHHRFHRRHRRLRGRLPRHCYTTHPTHRELAWDFRATSHTLISSKW
jgi:hypothetical protein